MDPFKGKYVLTVHCKKLTCSFRRTERNMLFGEVALYLPHWERFCFNETVPKQVKMFRCKPDQFPNWRYLHSWGCEKISFHSWKMKTGIWSLVWPAFGVQTLLRAWSPCPSHLVQQQQPKAGKTSLLPHSPVLLGALHPRLVMKRNNF